MHLAMAIYAFAALEWVLFSVIPEATMQRIIGGMVGGYGWLLVLGAFIFVSWIADRWARSDTSRGMQYAGLMLYVAAEAVIFLPILYIAQMQAMAVELPGGLDIISAAAITTLIIFGGLTAIVFASGKDFSFLRSGLMFAGLAAIGLIVCSILFGFSLGVWFSAGMIIFAGAYILYDTSNVIHHYRTDQYVAASLTLFASVALMFWYVLQLIMSLTSRD
jgi:hypothetical protein